MNKTETAQIINLIRVYYRNAFNGITPQEIEDTVTAWADLFADMPVEAVRAAVKVFAATDTTGYPPAPGQIRDIIFRAMEKQDSSGLPSEEEAVMLVKSATANGNYGSEQEFKRLPPVIQDILGWPGTLRSWAMLDRDEFETVVLSQFRRQYRDALKSGKTERKTPENTGHALADTVRQMLASGDSLEAYIAGLLDGSSGR